jgi:hypothetical protein
MEEYMMAPDATPLLFQFEKASTENMTFMPMIVRFHLDRLGLHLSFAQWQALPDDERRRLACFPVDERTPRAQPAPESDAFEDALAAMLRRIYAHAHTDAQLQRFAPEASPAWQCVAAVPDEVIHQADMACLPAPGVAQWARLALLQRYALCKLSRRPQLHRDFIPAMREFGLCRT